MAGICTSPAQIQRECQRPTFRRVKRHKKVRLVPVCAGRSCCAHLYPLSIPCRRASTRLQWSHCQQPGVLYDLRRTDDFPGSACDDGIAPWHCVWSRFAQCGLVHYAVQEDCFCYNQPLHGRQFLATKAQLFVKIRVRLGRSKRFAVRRLYCATQALLAMAVETLVVQYIRECSLLYAPVKWFGNRFTNRCSERI